PRTRTTRQLAEVIYRLAGQPRTKLRSTPVLLLRALGVTSPTVRELLELRYEFEEPFIVDSTKIATKLEVHATPLDQAWPAPWPPTAPAQHRKPAGLRSALRRITPARPQGVHRPVKERAPAW